MTKQAVSTVIFNASKTEVLLIKRRDIPVWVLPGGGLDENESPEIGALREAEEETGLECRIRRKVAEYLPVNKLTLLTHFYELEIVTGTPQTGSETKEIQFFPIDKLPIMPPPYTSWIHEALRNDPSVIRKEIEGVNYLVLIKFLFLHPLLVSRYLLTKIGIHLNY